MMTFAQRLKYERVFHAWSQEQLAELVGTSARNVRRWERGSTYPNFYFRQKLAELLGKSTFELGLLEANPDRSVSLPEQEGTHQPLGPARPEVSSCLWNLPRPRNPLFTGREAILAEMYRALSHDQARAGPSIQAITGLGGVGKTQAALEYAYRFAEVYQGTLWLRAETRETLYTDLVALVEVLQLGVSEGQPLNMYLETIKRWLEGHSGWLLVVDDLENLVLLHEVLPVPCHGHVLVTTQVQATGPEVKRLDLAKMAPEEGALLLLRRAKRLDPAASLEQAPGADRQLAMTLAEQLDGLPLALDQAGAYIEEATCSLAHYAALLQHHHASLLGLRDLSGGARADHPRSVRATLALALEQLRRENPAALELLRLCAFLHPEAIPESLLQDGASELGPLLEDLAREPLHLDKAIADLRRYSLLQRQPEVRACSLHHLVQAVVQDTLEKAAQREWVRRVVRVVSRAFPEVAYATWERCQQLMPHALQCARLIERWGESSLDAAHLLNQAGCYLKEQGVYAQAVPLFERALAIREQILEPTHLDVARCLSNLAVVRYLLGQYEQALTLHQRALAIDEQALGPVHPNVATDLSNLGIVYQRQGQYEHALTLHQRALAIREQVLEPTPPHVARCLNNLAGDYYFLGRYEHALPLYQRALTIREQALEPAHPEVAASLNNLAEIYHKQGQDAEALTLGQQALMIFEEALGPTHPVVAQCLSTLAGIYLAQGKFEHALPLLERALAIDEQAYGPTHPDVATDLNDLAILYRQQGQYDRALSLHQRALTMQEQALGPEHPEVAASLHHMATLARVQGRYEEALPLYQQALAIGEHTLGFAHPEVAGCLEQYTALLHAIQQHDYTQGMEESRTLA